MNLHRALRSVPNVREQGEARAGAPGKIVNVFGVIGEGLSAVGIFYGGNQIAGRADEFVLRDGDFHIKSSKVREKFGICVKLVAIPGVLPPHAHFRKPLADHVEVAFVTGTFDNFGELVTKRNVESYRGARRNRAGERNLEDGAVGGVVVIRMNE